MEEWSKEKIEEIQNFIKNENEKRSFFARLKTKYLSFKFKIQDWLKI